LKVALNTIKPNLGQPFVRHSAIFFLTYCLWTYLEQNGRNILLILITLLVCYLYIWITFYETICTFSTYRSFFHGTLHMWARIDEEHN
jgi:hypothetical protein